MTKTFDINLYDGHLIFNNNGQKVLVDTGSPVTISRSDYFVFIPNRSLAPILFSNIKILSCPPQSQERLSLVHVSHKT